MKDDKINVFGPNAVAKSDARSVRKLNHETRLDPIIQADKMRRRKDGNLEIQEYTFGLGSG
jgi:hypothetical protein